jgi:hypothetical protein
VETVYGDKALKKTAIYAILKKLRQKKTNYQRHLNPKKTGWTASLIVAVAASVDEIVTSV